jgi:hypothetical protein
MVKFSTEFPSPNVVAVPEYFRGSTVGGLIPGEIVYPYTHIFKKDLQTGLVYVRTTDEIDNDARKPQYFGQRASLLRLYEEVGDELIDGFVADFRRAKPGSFSSVTIHLPEDASSLDHRIAADAITTHSPLLAAVFEDPDGNAHFMGDASLSAHVELLMNATDAMVESSTGSTKPSQAPEETEVPGYYYG